MDCKEYYRSRRTDADTALEAVRSGDKILIAPVAAQPKSTLEALARRLEQIDGITAFQMLPLISVPYLADKIKDKVRFVTCYSGPGVRDHINNDAGEYVPVFLQNYSDLAFHYNPDVVLAQVSPPDNHGFCSLGVSVLQMKSAIQNAKIVIAEVNEQMPRVHGDTFLHVSEFSHFVECNHPVVELPRPFIGETEEAIGRQIAELIPDGACLQLGIGAIPDAVLRFLKDKRGLGIHSEMFSDGVMELYQEGVIDNKSKTLHKDKMISTFLMGTRKLYDFIDDNPCVQLYPAEYCNCPTVIGQNKNLISVNSSVSVDFMGQAASESIGTRQFSGTGGQVDFIRGAALSQGGRSILAFPSTAGKDSEHSRIVPQLALGTPVTTSRNDIDYVVTEYGVARLKYKSMRERALELINIAHPAFRPELEESLKKLGW